MSARGGPPPSARGLPRAGSLPGLRDTTSLKGGGAAAAEPHQSIAQIADQVVSTFDAGSFSSQEDDKAHEARMVADMEDAYAQAEAQRLNNSAFGRAGPKPSVLRDVLNTSHVLSDGAAAIVDDSFLKCFTSMPPDPWNWNAYLFPAWLLGVLFRRLILFPIRVTVLVMSNILFLPIFFAMGMFMKPGPKRSAIEQRLITWLCGAWMMAWCAVVKYHGPRPTQGANKVWVANHTSMIDYAILCSHSPFAVIMQLQHGWVRFLQTRVLSSLGCLWFNRTDIKDRQFVVERMKAHVSNPESVPLLIFPEGTCVNNEYTVLFKRGAFELGAAVCPIAIKYNKIFVDAFWNSRRQPFSRHMLKLMTSWATVCDVWFLEPQHRGENEPAEEFAARVQRMIAETAGLKIVPWDGYLKYYNLGQAKPGLIEKRRAVFADVLRQHLPGYKAKNKLLPPVPEDGGLTQDSVESLKENPNKWRGPPGVHPAVPPPSAGSPWRGPWTSSGWGVQAPAPNQVAPLPSPQQPAQLSDSSESPQPQPQSQSPPHSPKPQSPQQLARPPQLTPPHQRGAVPTASVDGGAGCADASAHMDAVGVVVDEQAWKAKQVRQRAQKGQEAGGA